MANLGVGAVDAGVAACSIGTSGALRLTVEHPGIDPARRLFCYALLPDRWVVGGAIKGVCQQLALVLASVRAAGHEVREVRATGGFARSGLWRQMLSDVPGVPVGFPAGHQGSALGAAVLGLWATGVIDSVDRARDLVALQETITPHPAAAATYAALRPLFAALYDELMPAFRLLAGEGG